MLYCWKAMAGVSAFGKYEGLGNAATNVVVNNMGFLTRWLIVKNVDASGNWVIIDSFRDSAAEKTAYLEANGTNIEASGATFGVTFTSTGFTFDSGTTTSGMNTSGQTYVYMAFA